MANNIHIALVQQACCADKAENLAKTCALIEQAAAEGAELVALQELHATPYFCQTEDTDVFDLAEPIPGPTSERLGATARKAGVVLIASLFERRAAGLYHNTAVVFEKDGALVGKYRKMHIPDDPAYYEKFYFTPGDLGFEPVNTSVGRLGVLVCWDQWYPEGARLMALRGADFLIYPTAIGYEPTDSDEEKNRQREAWVTIQRSHAVANGLHVLSINRVGHEPSPDPRAPGIDFWGHSFVAGPQGEFLAQGPSAGDAIIHATLDLVRTEAVRRIWPFLRDRRIDAYAGLEKRLLD